ncbi:hypothetical protein BH10ACT1_BH10ACT1_17050 [soil metagenome]
MNEAVHEFIGFTISGMVTAGIYAIVACGLTLTFTTTGIFNWAHGALVAVGAFSYWQLTEGWGVPAPIAIAVCLLVLGPLLGVIIELGIMHRLEGTSEATRMVVTLALLLGILAGINWIWEPNLPRYVAPLFDGHVLTVFDQRIPYQDLTTIGVALAVAVALRWLLYRTRAGVEMRAAVDDRALTTLNGGSVRRTALRSWSIGSSLAVLAGILIAPRGALVATSLALLIVNAYAAAVIGRLRNLPMTFLGAVVLGLANGYGQGYVGSRDIPGVQYLSGLINVLPVLVLFIALQFLPQSRLRGSRALRVRELSSTPTWPGTAALAVGVVVATVAVAPLLAPGDLNSATHIWGTAIIALSLVPLIGYAGRLSACALGFAAVGAIVAAHLGTGSPLVLVFAALITAAVGALVALSAFRLSGLYLGLATAAFAVMLDGWIFKLPKFTAVIRIPFTDVTLYRHDIDIFQGGNLTVRRFDAFGISTTGDGAFFTFGAVVFAFLVVMVAWLRRSDFGLRLIALKDSQVGCATLGINDRVATLAVFAISAGMAGIGGVIFGAAIQRPAPDVFTFFNGLGILVALVIMGVSSPGAAVGTGLFLGGPTLANLFPSLAQLSSAMIATAGIGLGQNPNGAIPTDLRRQWDPVVQARVALGAGLGVIAAAYAAARTDVIGNWALIGVIAVVLLALPVVAKRITGPVADTAELDAAADGLSGPPELLGLAAPLSPKDLAVLSQALDVPERIPTGASR